MTPRKKPLSERFEDSYIPEPNSGCWLWLGSTKRGGYGQISAGGRGGKNLSAHRVSLDLAGINVPDNLHVLHRCDNPACVNPDHLFVGTQADNMRDMHAKGRANTDKSMLIGKPRPGRIVRGVEHWHFGKFQNECKRGHKFTEENTIIGDDGHRRCRACRNERSRVAMRAKSIKRSKAGSLTISAEK